MAKPYGLAKPVRSCIALQFANFGEKAKEVLENSW